jgi:peptide/nickel transport system substrate-binding protein
MGNLLRATVIAGVAIGMTAMAANAETPKRGGIFEYGVKAGIPTYDLQGSGSYGTLHRTEQHYSLLVTFDWKNFPKINGDIAESWDISEDSLTYTFKIRKGVKFHDGTPLTSADVLASFNRLRTPKEGIISPRQAYFNSVAEFAAPDPHTFVVHFSEPPSTISRRKATGTTRTLMAPGRSGLSSMCPARNGSPSATKTIISTMSISMARSPTRSRTSPSR